MDDDEEPRALTNAEFAAAVGVHFSMSSRLRNGERIPSSGLLARIVQAYDLSPMQLEEMFVALNGPDPEQAFGRWISAAIFDAPIHAA